LTRDLDVEGTILPNTIKTRSGKNLPRNTPEEGTKILPGKALTPDNPEWFAEGVKQTRSNDVASETRKIWLGLRDRAA
jgi:hypothetical protein